jgi:hypothetical protein
MRGSRGGINEKGKIEEERREEKGKRGRNRNTTLIFTLSHFRFLQESFTQLKLSLKELNFQNPIIIPTLMDRSLSAIRPTIFSVFAAAFMF